MVAVPLTTAFCHDAAIIGQSSPYTIRTRPPGSSEPLTRG